MTEPNRIDLQEIAPAEVGEIDLYQHREKIYTRKIEGFFQRVRLFSGWPLLLGYLLLPWLYWDGRQAVLFDLPARKFHILGLTFWPQDFPMLAFLLIIAAFALFAVTTFAGTYGVATPAHKQYGPVYLCGWNKKRRAAATNA